MRIGIAAAICAALLGAGPVYSATAEREKLLEALAQAYPAALKTFPVGPALTAGVRDRLIQENPGREDAIAPILAEHDRCLSRVMDMDFGTPLAAAVRASNLSDEDLRVVVGLYTDPELTTLFGKLSIDPAYKPTATDIGVVTRLAAKSSDPAMKRFLKVTQEAPEMKAVQTAFADGLDGCRKAAEGAAGKAGLKQAGVTF